MPFCRANIEENGGGAEPPQFRGGKADGRILCAWLATGKRQIPGPAAACFFDSWEQVGISH